MKKQILVISMIVLTIGTLFLVGCSKSDTTPPVITLKGSNPMSMSLNSTYTEPGFTANDNKDGDVSAKVSVSGTVNNNLKGAYTLTYSVTDAAGNVGTATRTVNVNNDCEFLATGGAFVNCHDTETISGTPHLYDATISTSNTVNNAFSITNFGGFGTSFTIPATINNTGTTISFQVPVTLPNPYGSMNAGYGTVLNKTSPTSIYFAYSGVDSTANPFNDHAWFSR